MIVTRENFVHVLNDLSIRTALALDTETTGLRPYHGDEPFSIIVHDGLKAFYFNFNDYEDFDQDQRLDWEVHGGALRVVFGGEGRTWYLHNAKFDMAMLATKGIELAGTIHDTMVTERVLDSTAWQFSLDAIAARIGYQKLDTVKTYIVANKLFTVEKIDGKKTQVKKLHYALAPWDLIVPYGERDGEITWKLAERQREELLEIASAMPAGQPNVCQVYENERELVRTVYDMERAGVLIDRDYCRRAIEASDKTLFQSELELNLLSGQRFKDGALFYQAAFADLKDRWVYGDVTPTGKKNPSFDSDVLATFDSPIARAVLRWRKAKSDAGYYHGFLYEADGDGVIHASFNQHVAVHGRFSSSNPNLQNLTKSEDEELADEFVVRRAIVPRPGCVFHMLDYRQMEYRLMLDYAARYAADKDGVLALIAQVLGGLDVHEATARGADITRGQAKTTNFAILYGSGNANLATGLKVSESRARAIRDSVFRAAPELRTFIRRVTDTAEKRGFIVNWFGRRCSFPDATVAYRAGNYLIAGGCADVVKVAMNQINRYLRDFKTRLVLMVHDELVLEGPPSEAAEVVPAVQKIMETVYPARFVPLTCGVDHSYKSLADKEEGIACFARD